MEGLRRFLSNEKKVEAVVMIFKFISIILMLLVIIDGVLLFTIENYSIKIFDVLAICLGMCIMIINTLKRFIENEWCLEKNSIKNIILSDSIYIYEMLGTILYFMIVIIHFFMVNLKSITFYVLGLSTIITLLILLNFFGKIISEKISKRYKSNLIK